MAIRRKHIVYKSIIAGAVVAIAGVAGSANLAQAAHGDKPSRDQCAASRHANHGQCTRIWVLDNDENEISGHENVIAADDEDEDEQSVVPETEADVDVDVAVDANPQTETDIFTDRISALSAQAEARLTPEGQAATQAFYAQFATATDEYEDSVADAFATFSAAIADAADTAESRNQFIDRFNRAKAEYLNSLDAAKNRYASELSNMGHGANVVKDEFMNGFNAARDAYSNQLEAAKNEFAATIQ